MASDIEQVVNLSKLSIAGIQQIWGLQGGSVRKVVFWLVVFVCSSTVLSYQIGTLVDRLESYPTAVDIQITNGPVEFPTVTFCSLALLKKSVVSKIPVFKAMETAFANKPQHRRKRTAIANSVVKTEPLQPQIEMQTDDASELTSEPICSIDIPLAIVPYNIDQADKETTSIPVSALSVSTMVPSASIIPVEIGLQLDSLSTAIQQERSKRSVASINSCPNGYCDYTPIQLAKLYGITNSLITKSECINQCGNLGAVSYSYTTAAFGVCTCYSEDCCTSKYLKSKTLDEQMWSPNPFCGPIAMCDNVFTTNYGSPSLVRLLYHEQTVVTYTCAANAFTAFMQTSTTYTCLSTGQWSSPFAPCIPSCANHFSTATGSINSRAPYMPGTYTFTCASGYVTTGNIAVENYICTTGNWDKPFNPCSLMTCNDQFVYTFGSVSPAAPFVSGSTYTFTCKSYWLTANLLPSLSYYCSSGNWLQQFSPCYAVCPNIFDTTGSVGSAPFMGLPKSYTFACLSGFLLPNYATTQQYTCQTNGIWSPSVFTACLKECQMVLRPQVVMKVSYSQTAVQTLMPSGTISSFACSGTNYTFFGNINSTKCDNGSWDLSSAKYPTCLANCISMDPTTLSDRLNVNYSRSNPLINGTVATFSCNDSYHMYGDFPKTNCLNGSWDVAVVDFPICLEQQVANYDAKTLRSFADPTGDNLAIGLSMVDMIPYITANLSESMKISLGFGLDDNLVSCAYDGRICDKSEIIGFNDDSGGNCYSFNHKYQNESIIAERPGMESGLHWILNTRQEEFLSMMPTAGVKLIIHQRFDSIFADSMGIQVSPGFNYIIAIRRKTELRVETPNSICYNQTSRANYYFLENSTYGIEACKRSYSQAQIINGCGCGSPNLPHSNSGSDLCTLENRTCVIGYLNETNISKGKSSAYCAAACSGVIEQTVVTMTANADNSELFNPDVFSKQYQRSNLVSVKVFFESLEVQHFNERISYGILDLINDVASAIGVMVGMSFVSLFELIALAVRLGFYLTKIVKKRT